MKTVTCDVCKSVIPKDVANSTWYSSTIPFPKPASKPVQVEVAIKTKIDNSTYDGDLCVDCFVNLLNLLIASKSK